MMAGIVALQWNPPASSPDPVAGYSVYRSPAGESAFSLLNSSLLTVTSFADSTAQDGITYDYVILSVDAPGVASGPSNLVRAVGSAATAPNPPVNLTATPQ